MATYKGTVINPGTDAEVASQVSAIDAKATTPQAVAPIPVSSLSTPAPTPIKVPTPTSATAGTAVDSMIGAQAKQGVDQFTQDQATATKNAEAGYNNSLDAVLKQLTSTEGQTTLTAKEYAGSVDPAKKALNDINQQILADQEAERQQIIRIKENPNGLFGGALEQQIGELQDKGIQRRAGLAVTQIAAQGNYQLAKEIADRAVEATMERQKIKNDTLQFIFTQNKELFNKAEQRQFETAQADRNRKLEFETYKEKSKYDQIIKQSDPLYAAQLDKAQYELAALKNPTSISGISKETADRMDKLPLTEKNTLVDATDTVDQLTRLKDLVATTDIVTLQNPLTPQGILFNRLATDVADKMARKRTGAVVTASEQANFKKILGLSFFTRLNSDPATVNSEIDKFINLHESTAQLIDPRGDIRTALKQNTANNQESAYVDNVANTLGGGGDSISAYLASFNPK